MSGVGEMKKEFKVFLITDYEEEGEYLSRMLRRVFQARLFPILIIMFCLVIPQFVGLMDEQRGDRWILLILYSILLTLYTYICVKFGLHY